MEDSIYLLPQVPLSKVSFNHWKLMRYFDRWIVHHRIIIVSSLSSIVSLTVWTCLKVARRIKKNVSFYRSAERKLCTCILKWHSVHFEEIKSSERMIVLQVISCGCSLIFFFSIYYCFRSHVGADSTTIVPIVSIFWRNVVTKRRISNDIISITISLGIWYHSIHWDSIFFRYFLIQIKTNVWKEIRMKDSFSYSIHHRLWSRLEYFFFIVLMMESICKVHHCIDIFDLEYLRLNILLSFGTFCGTYFLFIIFLNFDMYLDLSLYVYFSNVFHLKLS